MSGVPGAGGPVPKRSDQRRRRNAPEIPIDKAPAAPAAPIDFPAPSAHWDGLARDWYLSLAKSGQAVFYQPSDWQYARIVAEGLHKMLTGKFTAVAFQAVMSSMTVLLVTEGDRRRLRIELERVKPVDPDAVLSDEAVDAWLRTLTS